MGKKKKKINSPLYEKIVCSISGGSDSDIMLDICYRCDKGYIWLISMNLSSMLYSFTEDLDKDEFSKEHLKELWKLKEYQDKYYADIKARAVTNTKKLRNTKIT